MAYQQNKGPMYCRTCEQNGIKTEIAFSKLQKSASGRSIPLEKSTMKPHQCPYSAYAMKQDQKYSPQGQQEFVEQYRITSPQQQIPVSTKSPAFEQQPRQKGNDFLSERIDVVEAQFQRLDAKIDNLNIAIAKVMSMVQSIIDVINIFINEPTVVENRILKAKVNELQALVADREQNFVPANQVPSSSLEGKTIKNIERNEEGIDYDQHVRDMVKKGETEEELDLT